MSYCFFLCLLLATKCLKNISCSNLHCKDNEIRILIRFQESSKSINSTHDLYYGIAYRQAKSGAWWQVLRHSKPYKSEKHKCHIFCVLLQSYKTLSWLQNSFHLPLGNVNRIWQAHHIEDGWIWRGKKRKVTMFIALKKEILPLSDWERNSEYCCRAESYHTNFNIH